MAHKGNLYKVQFRRDLHLDLDNRFGYPEAYNVQVNGVYHAGGSPLGSINFLCVNLLTSTQPPMVWVSPWVTSFGFTFRVTITIVDPAIRTGDNGVQHVTVEEITQGVVAQGDCAVTGWAYDQNALFAILSSWHFAPGWSFGPTQAVTYTLAADYASYNP